MTQNNPDQDLYVDRVLFDKILKIGNRSLVRKTLFALSRGQEQRKTSWPDITHARIESNRIIASVHLGNDMAWRDGRLTIKNKQLPETVLSALQGKEMENLVEHEFLKECVITRAKNTKIGIEVRSKLPCKTFKELWCLVGGD